MYERLGWLVTRWALVVVLAWLALLIVSGRTAPDWDQVTQDGDLAYLPDRMTTVRGERLLIEAFPDVVSRSQLAIIVSRSDGPLESADRRVLARLAERFAPQAEHGLPIVQTWTPRTEVIGSKLASRDGRAELILLLLSNEFMALDNIRVLQRVEQILDEQRTAPDFPAGLVFGVSGSAAVGGDMLSAARESIRATELITVSLVLLILLLVYRAPLLALVPLTTIGVSFFVATHTVAALAQLHTLPGFEWFHFQIFKTTRIFLVTILFGSGTDFCLFLIARYKEELQRGEDRAAAVRNALGAVGDALTASALTTIVGLSMMYFADFGKFRNSGPAIGLCLLITLAACLTLTPALLRLLGPLLFWPFGPQRSTPPRGLGEDALRQGLSTRFWRRLADAVLARPGLILVVSVLLLSPLAMAGWSVPVTYNLLDELGPNRPSVRGTELARRHFPAGETSPMTVLATRPQFQFDSAEGRKAIEQLTRKLYEIVPGEVVSVRSLTEPLGDPPAYRSLWTNRGRELRVAREHPRTRRTYVAQVGAWNGQVTRFDIITRHDPFSPEAAAVLERVERFLETQAKQADSAWFGADFDMLGTTAGTRDLRAVTSSDQRLIQRLVTLAVLGVLLVLLRRPVVCLYLICSVLFSYLVTIGATRLVFGLLFPESEGLDWKVPIFLFVILVAVGQDYNIYLATRVFEEQRRLGAKAGLREAMVRTGGIITSCGVIMAGTFVSMTSGSLRGMVELGFALTLGILLDTFVVRTILVPAFLALLTTPLATQQQALVELRPPQPDAAPHTAAARLSGVEQVGR